jgi:hypothetical protein
MIPPFDIFRVDSDGQLMWKATVETLDVARVQIKILMRAEAGDYIIHSQPTGHKMVIKADGSIVVGSIGPTREDR